MRTPALKLIAALALALSASSLLAQDWAKSALEKSPRHREYVPLKHGDRTVQAFVVYPEVSHKAPVVVMIFEIFGLSDWAKLMADEIAAQGFIVVAPDLLTGFGPNGGGSDSFASQDATTKAVSGLDAGVITADLDAAADYGKKLPSANGKLFVTGFCWGGGKSFAYATHRHDLSAAFVFYGPPPSNDDLKGVTAPVYGFYAGNDARITATVPATTDAMKALGKKYEAVTYDGAGHGFMRAGQAPDATPANKAAYEQGFKRMIELITKTNATTSTLRYVPIGSHKPVLANVAATKQKPAAASASASTPASTPMICHDPTPASAANSTRQSTAKPAAMDMSSM